MARQAPSCAVLLLLVTLPLLADVPGKPSSAAGGDSWAPLSHSAPPSTPASFGPAPTLPGKNSGTAIGGPPAGFHDVKVGGGGTIRVQNSPTASGGEFSGTSSFAGKTFSTQESSLSQSDTAPELAHRPFVTSSYDTASYHQSAQTFETAAYHADARSSDSFTKTYALPDNQISLVKPFTTKSSDLQDKQALIGQQQPTDPFATPWTEGDKKFYDPALRNVKRDPYAGDSLDVGRLTGLPNRPLTVDEVRSLVNHEQAPDLNAAPDSASKSLNDPNWEAPLKLPEINENRAFTPPPPDETKDGELPSPGMMAQPAGTVQPQK